MDGKGSNREEAPDKDRLFEFRHERGSWCREKKTLRRKKASASLATGLNALPIEELEYVLCVVLHAPYTFHTLSYPLFISVFFWGGGGERNTENKEWRLCSNSLLKMGG